MKFLFWNTHKNKDINYLLSEMILENDVSFIALAEYVANQDELLTILSEHGKLIVPYMNAGCNRITLLGNINNVIPGTQTDYASIQIINKRDIICSIHLPSKLYDQDGQKKNIIITEIIENIQNAENDLNTRNTIIVGDFNINPYDPSCVDAPLFHGIPVYTETQRNSRVISGKEFNMFYNPMWNFLGDFSKPYGTYYYSGNDPNNTFWNIYDQVLIRPTLRKRFVDNSLRIITQINSTSLLNKKGHPNKIISDHLPITFEILED